LLSYIERLGTTNNIPFLPSFLQS